MLGAVAALVVIFSLLALTRGALQRSGGSRLAHGDVLVVFPIASTGQELASLGRHITELLSRNLDGAGNLRVVDPATVSRLSVAKSGALETSRAATLASNMGASRFVTGRVAGSPGRVRVQLTLHDTDAGHPLAEAATDGSPDDLFALTDQLTAQLLGALVGPASRRAARTAALTTTSHAALKEFLRAEEQYRLANYDSAIAGFQRAVAIDTTFALAYYRLAVVAGLYDREPNVVSFASEGAAPTALERALALVDRLSEHDRRLLDAYRAYRSGDADVAERQYRALLRDYPDNIEARFLLAEVQFRFNALRGRDPAEAAPDYEHVMRVDPDFFCPI